MSQYGPFAFDDFWRDSDDACMRCKTVGRCTVPMWYLQRSRNVRTLYGVSFHNFAWYDPR